jgi:AcrR family transcriptional regulator
MAIDQLCRTAPYDGIGVKQVCALADVSRASFYRVFADKYEPALWFQSVIFEASLRHLGRTLDWKGAYAVAESGRRLAPDLVAAALKTSGPQGLPVAFQAMMRDILVDTVQNYLGRGPDEDLLFQIEFYTRSAVQASEWFDGLSTSVAGRDAEMISQVVPRRLYELLDKPADPRKPELLTASSFLALARELEG